MYRQFIPKAWDIAAYTFQADIWCRHCMREYAVNEIKGLGTYAGNADLLPSEQAVKEWAVLTGINQGDESSYDSDDFPKAVFHSQVEDVEHCGQCGEEI